PIHWTSPRGRTTIALRSMPLAGDRSMAARALPNARLTAPRNVRAAVVQAASVAFDRDGTLDRVEALAARAAAEGAELVVFPEAFVSGYPKGVSFGATVGIRARGG